MDMGDDGSDPLGRGLPSHRPDASSATRNPPSASRQRPRVARAASDALTPSGRGTGSCELRPRSDAQNGAARPGSKPGRGGRACRPGSAVHGPTGRRTDGRVGPRRGPSPFALNASCDPSSSAGQTAVADADAGFGPGFPLVGVVGARGDVSSTEAVADPAQASALAAVSYALSVEMVLGVPGLPPSTSRSSSPLEERDRATRSADLHRRASREAPRSAARISVCAASRSTAFPARSTTCSRSV